MMRGLFCVAALVVVVGGCTRSGGAGGDGAGRPLGSGFSDDFERSELGPDWLNTGGPYRIEGGVLRVQGARNHPLWLKRTLPADLRVSFETWSDHEDGDIKFELFGDGVSFAKQASYTATGYVFIFGGWRNRLNVLARMDEHGEDRQVKRGLRVERGRRYAMKVERRGGMVRWWVDDEPMLELDDPEPLAGRGHDHFGFNNWETPLSFDNVRIEPL